MESVSKITYLFILLFVKNVFSVNILHVAHIASPSHHIWNRVLALGLANKGYNVTMVSHDREKTTPPNFSLILLEGLYDQAFQHEDFNMDDIADQNALRSIKTIYDWSAHCCEYDFTTNGLQVLLNYPRDFKFDLIIYDVTLGQCLYPIIERFHNPPVIGVTPFLLPPVLSDVFGNPLQTSYLPYYSTTYSDRMSFTQRILNFIYIYAEVLYRKYIALPAEMRLAQKYFGNNISPFEEVERNISLLLCNTDPILTYPLDLPPNIIPVGGLQIQPLKALPKDIQKVMDGAKHGVILFTLGSNLRSDKLSLTKRKAILDTFRKIPQTVLWKFETDNLEGLPKNVVIRKWLPQSDILGHPNTKLFISHGGGLGTQEAMHHGVPVVGIPFFADQRANMGRLVQRKMARSIDFKNLTFENLHSAVIDVLNKPMYSENIKTLSKRYRDQPQTPLERAIFWVEYVLRHEGAEHLVLAARDMPFYQTANLDVLAVLVLGVIVIYSFTLLIITGCRFIRIIIFG